MKAIFDFERGRSIPPEAVERIYDAIRKAGLDIIADDCCAIGIRIDEV